MKKLLILFIALLLLPWSPVAGHAGISEVTFHCNESIDHQYLFIYRIYWGNVANEFPKPNKFDLGLGLTYTTPPLQDGTYYFSVTAVDKRGLESLPSNEVTITLDTVPPRSPRNLKSVSVKITVSLPSGTVTVVQTTGN